MKSIKKKVKKVRPHNPPQGGGRAKETNLLIKVERKKHLGPAE